MKLSEMVSLVSIGEKKFAMVPVDKMRVDKMYQRVLHSRVKKMADHWDYNKCDVLIVSFRSGYFYIVDGQHRFEAARKNGVQFLACQILVDMSQIDEARRFLAQNTEACSLTPYDTWNANLLIGDFVDCTIDKICKEFGVHVIPTKGIKAPAVLGSLVCARRIVKQHGADGLRWILSVLDAAKWNEVPNGHGKVILFALNTFYSAHKDNIYTYTDRVKCVLHRNDQRKFQSKAVAMFPENELGVAVSRYLDYIVTGEPKEVDALDEQEVA